MSALFVLGILLLFGAGGVIPALVGNITMRRKAAESLSWPTTQGTIRSSKIESHWVRVRGMTFDVVVTYDYTVEGVSHEHSGIGFYSQNGNFGTDENAAKVFLAEHPAGAIVTVHYDPSDPASAVLVPGGAELATVPLIFFPALGLAFLAGAIACFVRWSR